MTRLSRQERRLSEHRKRELKKRVKALQSPYAETNIERHYAKVRKWLEKKIPFKADEKSNSANFSFKGKKLSAALNSEGGRLTHIFPHPDGVNIIFARDGTRQTHENIFSVEFSLSTFNLSKNPPEELFIGNARNTANLSNKIGRRAAISIFPEYFKAEGKSFGETLARKGLGTLLDYFRMRKNTELGIERMELDVSEREPAKSFAEFRGYNVYQDFFADKNLRKKPSK